MIDPVDHRQSVGHESGEHEAGRGAQVGRHHLGSGEARRSDDDRRPAVDANVGAHALQLSDVHEAPLEDRLGDHRGALGLRHQRHVLGLHVRGEAGVRTGA